MSPTRHSHPPRHPPPRAADAHPPRTAVPPAPPPDRGVSPLSVLYVGPLPPYRGGSATVGAQLVVGLARRGQRVRALAPITPAALARGDPFATAHPALPLTRISVPHDDLSPDCPVTAEYRRLEREQVHAALERLIADERPHALVIGRSTFLAPVQDVAFAHDLPTLLFIHSTANLLLMADPAAPPAAAALLARY